MRFKEPMDLGGFRLCSRLVLPPMATKKSTPEGLVTEDLIEHYRRRAEGGSLENRLRIHREIIRGIRKRLGEDYPIAVRLGGALDNGLNPTTTLGCGTWGGNSISENIYYHNLMNVSRISYRIKGRKLPTDEEIWA